MIEVRFDKESELLWLKAVIGSGSLNVSYPYFLKALGVDMRQVVNYKSSDNYVDDVVENRKAMIKRFGEMDVDKANSILREEYLSKKAEEEGLTP